MPHRGYLFVGKINQVCYATSVATLREIEWRWVAPTAQFCFVDRGYKQVAPNGADKHGLDG
jgi:hypothetical protein